MSQPLQLTLYYHPLASFCHKVLIALYENDVAFDKRIINLGEEADRAELQAIWPLCKFPVLRDLEHRRDVPETSVIIEYLDRYYPGAQPMIPADWDAALDVRLWDRFFDSYVQGPVQTIVNGHLTGLQCDRTKERTKLKTAYKMIEKRMATRSWVCGDAFSLADCAAAPALFYAVTLLPFPRNTTICNPTSSGWWRGRRSSRCLTRPNLTGRCIHSSTIFRNASCKPGRAGEVPHSGRAGILK
jgi:glutathione S-transferase